MLTRFAARRHPEFSDVAAMLKDFRRSSVDRSFLRPDVDAYERFPPVRTPESRGQRSDTAAGWIRSPTSNDITAKVEELIARRRLMNKWLKVV